MIVNFCFIKNHRLAGMVDEDIASEVQQKKKRSTIIIIGIVIVLLSKNMKLDEQGECTAKWCRNKIKSIYNKKKKHVGNKSFKDTMLQISSEVLKATCKYSHQ